MLQWYDWTYLLPGDPIGKQLVLFHHHDCSTTKTRCEDNDSVLLLEAMAHNGVPDGLESVKQGIGNRELWRGAKMAVG